VSDALRAAHARSRTPRETLRSAESEPDTGQTKPKRLSTAVTWSLAGGRLPPCYARLQQAPYCNRASAAHKAANQRPGNLRAMRFLARLNGPLDWQFRPFRVCDYPHIHVNSELLDWFRLFDPSAGVQHGWHCSLRFWA
jgi:hypothetical protein